MENLQLQIDTVKGFERTKNVWRTNYSSTEFIQASRLNQALFDVPLNHAAKCQCIEDLFFYIKNFNPEKINQKQKRMNGKFKFKKDTVIMLHGMNEALTEHNLTDDKAAELLAKYPSHIGSFEEFPANWKALADAAKKTTGKAGKGKSGEAGKGAGEDDAKKDTGTGDDEAVKAAAGAGKGEEDAVKNSEAALAKEIEAIKAKKKPELIKLVQKDKKKFPAAEWEALTRDELAAYIVGKLTAAGTKAK